MSRNYRRIEAVSIATVAAGSLIGALLWSLGAPGYSTTRLALFAGLAVAGLAGLIGIVAERRSITGIGVAVLFALGFWQAVLWIVVYPVIGAFLIALAIGNEPRADAVDP